MLIYLHGFQSSPLSTKAQLLKQWCVLNRSDIHCALPALPPLPNEAVAMLTDLIASHKDRYKIGIVGGSLGGYYATWLNDIFNFKTVVINPAVYPYKLLQNYMGEQQHPYTKERFVLTKQHMLDLKAIEVQKISNPSTIWLLQQKGDEVLNYRQAIAKYHAAKQTVENAGNHAFVGFDRYCEQIIQFLAL